MNEQQLLDLKKEMDQANETTIELTGRQKQLMETLQTDWSCGTVKKAETKVTEMDAEISQLNDKIKKGIEELDEKYVEG